MNDHVSLREFIERIIKENNKRRDDLRDEDRRWVEDSFKALDKALVLQASAYPTTKDFNELKTHVDVTVASKSGSSAAVTTLFQVLAAMNAVMGLVLAYLIYRK